MFWMAREVERMNNIARILDVHESFSRDPEGAQSWEAVLRLYDDHDRFVASGLPMNAENVLYFYLLDGDNPTSVYANLKMARENARSLRPLISTEMWVHLNTFYNSMRGMKRADIAEERINRVCARIKEAAQTHAGITAETLYRDEGWYFSALGAALERADQTTRLLDAKYEALLPSHATVGSAVDIGQWNSLLRSAAGFHAFRRIHGSELSAARAAGFLLFDDRFPRSVIACVAGAARLLADLRKRHDLPGGGAALDRLGTLHAGLAADRIERVIASGLHGYLDGLQQRLIAVTDALSADFFAF